MNVGSTVDALRERRTRAAAYVAIVLVLSLALGFQAVTAGGTAAATSDDGRWTATPPEAVATATTNDSSPDDGEESDEVAARNRSGVLVSVQSYGGFGQNNGRAVLVRDGDVVWSFAPEDSRVFDAELLDNGNVLVSYATHLPAGECPDEQLEYKRDRCVRNNVVELDYDTNEVVWEYRWLDAFINHHEVHDSDRLPSGETAIADMGNDRAFVVDENGSVVWEWRARDRIGPGTDFWETFGGPERPAPESDWMHMNDVDLTDDGDFLLSVRNFDVVLEVNRSTKGIEHVTGEPRETGVDVEGRVPILDDQHNPMLVGNESHVVVADSEADRIVEVNRSSGAVVWTFSEGLLWPRDADRLPNGNTLVTNSLRYEVEEVTPDGEIVWRYEVAWSGKRGIPYEADRVSIPEEPDAMPVLGESATEATTPPDTATTTADDESSATATPEGTASTGTGESAEGTGDGESGGLVDRLRGYALLYLPFWVGTFELVLVGGVALVGVVATVDGAAYALGRVRDALR